ncbi:MAG: FAD-dependent oxidoreductase, partial [Pseudomonadota bacterium]
ISGIARIADKHKAVLEDGTEIAAKNIIIATGSRPLRVPGFEVDETRILSSNGILSMTTLPKTLIILGAGPIGCEFAHVMTSFGVKVTLVEMAGHILPFEDEETVSVLTQSFKKKGINILTSTRAISLTRMDDSVEITVEEKDGGRKILPAEKVLCVFGRTPNTENIGLEAIGILTDLGYIPTGDYCQTEVPGVYAIGDVVKTPLLAHVASKEGEMAVEHMAGHPTTARIDINEVPSTIYCEPQIASFGLRESQAIEGQLPYKKANFPYRGIGKAVSIGKPDGMVKILYAPDSREILGAHIVGHDATEIIHEILLAKTAKILPAQVAQMIHAHPTISELVMEGMRAVDGQPIYA